MATMVWCLALLVLYNLMPSSESVKPDRRSEALEKYIVHDEARSHLFSQCMADANAIEGVLYSITVPGDEKYVRFVPKEKVEFQWTVVDIGDGKGTVGCAQKAYELRAYMFKFDGSCNVALDSAYDPESEQACDGAATEVVYISSGYIFIPVGESRGCLYGSPEGIRYGDEYGHLVDEVQLPPPDVCSPTADEGYHLVADCSLDGMNFCEAQARCEARGVPMASKIFYDELAADEDWTSLPSDVGQEVSSASEFKAWVNIQKINNTWKWMPNMEVILESDFPFETFDSEKCAHVSVYNSRNTAKFYSWDCSTMIYCVYCHDPNSLLPQC